MKSYFEYINEQDNTYYVGDKDAYYTSDELKSNGYSWVTNSVTDEHFIIDGNGNIVGGTGISDKKSFNSNKSRLNRMHNATKIEGKLDKLNNLFNGNTSNLSDEKKKALNYLKNKYPEGIKFYRNVTKSGSTSIQIPEPYKNSEREEILKNILIMMDMPYNNEGTHYKTGNPSIEVHLKKTVGSSYKAEDYFPENKSGKEREYSSSEHFRKDVLSAVSSNKKLTQFKTHVESILGTKDKPKTIAQSIESLAKCTNEEFMVSFNEVIMPYLLMNRHKLNDKEKEILNKNENCKKILTAIDSIHPGKTPSKIIYPSASNSKMIDFMIAFKNDLPSEVISGDISEEELEKLKKEQEQIVGVSMKNNEGNAIGISQINEKTTEEVDEFIKNSFGNDANKAKNSPVYRLFNAMKSSGPIEKGNQTSHLLSSLVKSIMPKDMVGDDFDEFINHIANPQLEKHPGQPEHKRFMTEKEKDYFKKYKSMIVKLAKDNGFGSEEVFNNYPDSIPYIFSGIMRKQCENDPYANTMLMYLMGIRDVYQLRTITKNGGVTAEMIQITGDSPTKCKFGSKISSDCYYSKYSYGMIGVRFAKGEIHERVDFVEFFKNLIF